MTKKRPHSISDDPFAPLIDGNLMPAFVETLFAVHGQHFSKQDRELHLIARKARIPLRRGETITIPDYARALSLALSDRIAELQAHRRRVDDLHFEIMSEIVNDSHDGEGS